MFSSRSFDVMQFFIVIVLTNVSALNCRPHTLQGSSRRRRVGYSRQCTSIERLFVDEKLKTVCPHLVYLRPSFFNQLYKCEMLFDSSIHLMHVVVVGETERERQREKVIDERIFFLFYGNNNIEMTEQIEIHVNFFCC